MSETATGNYQVLARKYRPASFDDLIGQEPMVRTLRNAFSAQRIAHAWMLTGVRGVGKTTTARILARGLNFQAEDGAGGPTVDLAAEGVHCRAIMEGRHPDVIEMDAASHTGIDDIRDIIDSSRYSPVSARYKVYIVDEVHMLSKAAFNGLLKTLEEPPAHVKFVFATTEIRRVPVTVLSRCQRFDLRRIEAAVLIEHLRRIAAMERIEADDEALRLVARAAEGSVRDALSILDQAIAHGAGRVDAETVRAMLGLADRTRTIDLFEHVMRGDTPAALAELEAQHAVGADPLVVLADLAEFTHYVTRLKLAGEAAAHAAVSESERVRGAAFAQTLSIRQLSRAWQMLLKGIQEVGQAPRPMAAADMVLVRICHAADLPTPDEALRLLRGDAPPAAEARAAASSAPPVSQPAPPPTSIQQAPVRTAGLPATQAARAPVLQAVSNPDPEPVLSSPEPATPPSGPTLERFEDIVALAHAERDRLFVFALERQVRPVKMEPGRIEIALTPDAEPDLPQRLTNRLREWTGTRWVVVVGQEDGADTIHEIRERRKATALEEVQNEPLVQAVLARFPGAEIVAVRDRPVAPDLAPPDERSDPDED
ncbi:DNA polymerase III subunit gamma/tau [Faunimonas sp. B44]|uniref:DNA polymerase III subunit gamma/tau n=1 Tax=Faunimonas sp. B44 TaxID=3461493 RepID=UPI0040446CA7